MKTPTTRVHCEVDNWDFDPRYTEGACPICGWRPVGVATSPRPRWLAWADRVQWDVMSLIALFVVLLVMGVLVARAAGINPIPR